MSAGYRAISWNPQKRAYDLVVASGALLYLAVFIGLGSVLHPNATVETLVIRAFGTLALLLLHVILAIGPVCRLEPQWLPLLYNRRHLGVTMFSAALIHGVFSLVQFHALGDVHPLVSLFIGNTRIESLSGFPFQALGFFALLILFLMAATSHDFWLNNLTAPIWKRLHMLVYLAYALLIGHVTLGALQSETSPLLAAMLGAGLLTIITLHVAASTGERRVDAQQAIAAADGFVEVCEVAQIPEERARIVCVGGERVAIFRYAGKVSAIGNVCRHQGGPLGEGRIIDGCVTCPWHGYQYLPESGASPPPFTEKVPSFHTRIIKSKVLIHPVPEAPGTHIEPSRIA
jgi:sulfoxide reductase heme-binding subunit YedZ